MFDFNLPSNIIAFPTSYHSRHPRHLLRRISCSAVDEEQIQDVSFSDAKNSLITSLIGIQGRGRSASPAQLKDAENRMLLANLLMQNSAEDAENRMLSANLLMQNSAERPKVLTVEDKLVVLGCKDLDRKIVEAEMEITLAKIQGFLKDQLKQPGVSSGKKLLAVIGVYTGFGSRLNRNVFRGSWMPKGDSLKKLEERGIVIHFVIGRSPNRGDSLDRNIDEDQ